MAKNESRRMTPAQLAEDLEIYAALKGLTTYAPSNPAYTQAKLDLVRTALTARQEAEAQASAAYETERDNLVAAQWDLHNAILGAKDQVIAQFGPSSNEVQVVKLKKKTEYKTPTRRKAPAKP